MHGGAAAFSRFCCRLLKSLPPGIAGNSATLAGPPLEAHGSPARVTYTSSPANRRADRVSLPPLRRLHALRLGKGPVAL
mgnify:CR=1 FL=1